jgi:uncharacterized protein YqeY
VSSDQAGLRDRLQSGVRAAMKARDTAAVAALRSALAAIGNAEAAEVSQAPAGAVGGEHIAGAVVGLGAGEVPRRVVTEEAAAELVRAEVRDRLAAAEGYERAGQDDAARRLQDEAAALEPYLLNLPG